MGILSSILGTKALKKSNKKAMAEQQAGYDETKATYDPYKSFGLDSLAALRGGIGLGDSNAAIAQFEASPLYRLQYDAALKAGQTGTAGLGNAAGVRNSGRTLLALQDNARDITNRTYDQYLKPIAAGADVGLGVTNTLADLRMRNADDRAGFQRNKGEIKAGQYAGFDALLSDAFKAASKFATGFGGGMPTGGSLYGN